MRRLLDSELRALRPRKTKYRKSDGDSLYVTVYPSGLKTFELRKRDQNGKTTYEKIGEYPALSLRNARRASAVRREQIERAAARAAGFADISAEDQPPLTLGQLLRHYFNNHIISTYRRPEQVDGYIRNIDQSIVELDTYDLDTRQTREVRMRVAAYLRQFAKASGPVAGNRLLSILKQATRYGVVNGFLNVDPFAEITARYVGGTEKPRHRVLSDDEIKLLWWSRSRHTSLLRFMLATGQRIGETRQMRSEDIVDDRWHISEEIAKNKRAHWIPITENLRPLLDDGAQSYRVFGKTTETATQAWLRRWCDRNGISPRFRPHDLRRTFKTRLTALGIRTEVVERMMNHSQRGLEAVYNQHDWADDRFAAQALWVDTLLEIVNE